MNDTAKRPHSAEKLAELRRMVEPPLPPNLPGIDPSGVFVEDDPEELSSYARGLWQQWQALDRKDGTARARYPKTAVKAATVRLVDAYADAEAPIPYELSRLIRAIVAPAPKADTLAPVHAASRDAYWAAILYEAEHPDATLYAVAKELRDAGKVSTSQDSAEAAVRSWRRERHYTTNVRLFRKQKPDPE